MRRCAVIQAASTMHHKWSRFLSQVLRCTCCHHSAGQGSIRYINGHRGQQHPCADSHGSVAGCLPHLETGSKSVSTGDHVRRTSSQQRQGSRLCSR